MGFNKIFIIFLSLFFLGFSKLVKDGIILQNSVFKEKCPICGMTLRKFYKTNHIIKLKNKEYIQYDSLRCLVIGMKNKKIDKIYLIDAKTNDIIDTNKAYYVINSKIKGTMSKVSKFGFKNKKDALNFIKKNAGYLANFKEAKNIALKEIN